MVTLAALKVISDFALSTLASYFGEKMLDNVFNNAPNLEDELGEVIGDTILEYQDIYPQSSGRLLPFYHSKEMVAELLKFRIMKPGEYDWGHLKSVIEKEDGVMPPTGENVANFLSIFMKRISANEDLRKLEIKETFEEEVFAISQMLSGLSHKVDELVKTYNGDVELQWKSRIDAYVGKLKDFKPATALQLLDELQASIDLSGTKPNSSFMAFMTYQKGLCYGLLNRFDDAYKSYIKAYGLDNQSIFIIERAALAFYQLHEEADAKKLAERLIELDRFSPTGWAVWLLTEPLAHFSTALESVPKVVKTDTTFMRLMEQSSNREDRKEVVSLLYHHSLVPKCNACPIKEVTIDNYKDALFWINVCIREILSDFYFDLTRVSKLQSEELLVLNQLLTKVLTAARGTEVVYEENLLSFLLAFTDFYLKPISDNALAMETAYRKLPKLDAHYALHCANNLQITGHLDRAIAFIEEFDFKDREYLFLKLYIYKKAGDQEKYIASVKDFLNVTDNVSVYFQVMYFNLLVELKLTNTLPSFVQDDFVGSKTFENEEYKTAISHVANLFFNPPAEESAQALLDLTEKSEDKDLVELIGSSFFACSRLDDVITIFGKHLDTSMPHRGLYQYIDALYLSKTSHAKLLELLKKCRKEYPFNARLLFFEAELRQKILDWKEIIDICEYFLENIPDNESMLSLYVSALIKDATEESYEKIRQLTSKLTDFAFTDHQGIVFVSNALFTVGKIEQAFELLYRYAKDPKQVNLRMAYFNLCLRNSRHFNQENMPMQEFSEVKEGTWVKYELNGDVGFIEITDDVVQHRVYSNFIGKNAGDVIEVKRVFGAQTDNIVIKRIMDKFLYLHDEILEQAGDPLAGLPMQSFQIDPSNPNSFFDILKSVTGDQPTIEVDRKASNITSYYQGKMSFSEIANANYENAREAYYCLATQEKGIFSLPHPIYTGVIDAATTFVLDYSSLLFFYQLKKIHKVGFPHKFVISKYIYEYLKTSLNEIESGVNPLYVAGVNDNGEMEIDSLEKFNVSQLRHLNGLVRFIESHCEVRLSDRTMDFFRNAEFQIEIGEQHVLEVMASTVLLVEDIDGSFLVTDDLIYTRMISSGFEFQCSTEVYVKAFIGTDPAILNEFARNKYIGYSPTVEQLNEEFIKHLAGKPSHYGFLLQNLTISSGTQNLDTALAHIKELLLSPYIPADRLSAFITDALVNLLRFGDRRAAVLTNMRIGSDFKLLGEKVDLVFECFNDAIAILYGD